MRRLTCWLFLLLLFLSLIPVSNSIDVTSQIEADAHAYRNANQRQLIHLGNGNMAVVYTKADKDITVKFSYDQGATWVSERDSGIDGYRPVGAIDSDGEIHICYDYGNVYHVIYNYTTNTWGSPSNLGDGSSAKIAVDSNDNVHLISSYLVDPDYYLVYNKYTASSSSWSGDTILDTNMGGHSFDIAVDSSDNIHVVYHNETRIKYREYTTGWGAVVNITSDDAYNSYSPTLCINSSDVVHVAFHGTYSGQTKYQIRYTNNSGGSWNSIVNVTTSLFNQHASISIDSNDTLHLGWQGYPGVADDHRVVYASKTSSGSWSSISNLVTGIDDSGDISVGLSYARYPVVDSIAWGIPREGYALVYDGYSSGHSRDYYANVLWNVTLLATTSSASSIGYTTTTLNGVLTTGVNATCGFVLGNTTGVSGSSYWKNVTSTGKYNTSDSFSYDLTSLTSGKRYYFKAWANDGFTFNISTVEQTFDTLPEPPTGLTVSSYNDTQIVLTWTKGYNDTVIVRNTTRYPINHSDGTEVYNGSLETYTDTGLTPSTRYYYRAWNYVDAWGYTVLNTSTNQYTEPQEPQNVTSETTIVGGSSMNINISWNNGTGATQAVVRRSYTSQPTAPTDGTEVYNSSTNNYTVDTGITQPAYYTVFSYNTTTGLFSPGVTVDWYVVWISAYNETNGDPITGYSVFFSNPTGEETYQEDSCSNPHLVNVSDIPTGEDILLQVSANNYDTRLYYMDITVTGIYYINAYLNPTNESETYYIKVVGPQGEYGQDPPIEDAKVVIKRYVNETVGYENVTILFTDANGQAAVSLIPGTIYFVEISKTNYETELTSFQPREIVFAEDAIYTFRLIPTGSNILPGYDHFWDDVTFTGSMELNTGVNWTGNITISYSDSNLSTTNTQLKLMEMDGETLTFIGWFNTTGSNSWSHTFTGINSTRVHVGILYFNNTANYEVSSPVSITILNGEIYNSNVVKFNMQDRFENLFGPLPFDVIGIIGVGLGLIFLVSFGPYNTGLGIMMCGISMGIVHAIAIMWCDVGLSEASILLVPVIIVIAGVYMFTKDPQGHL